jgi:alpha-1,3-glucosyltransferase
LGVGIVGVGVIKTAVGYGGFSGKDALPMFGDFEAQRHWMEVTVHQPMGEWYYHEPEWWLLDCESVVLGAERSDENVIAMG